MKLLQKLGFSSKNEGKNIPPEVMIEFESIEREVLESNGKKDPYAIIWKHARKHGGFADAGEQPAQDSELDKLPTRGQGLPSGVIDTYVSNQPVTSVPTRASQVNKRGIISRFFGRKKQ